MVFQSDGFFEAYDKDAKQAMALFSNAALVKAGVARTNPSGMIVAAGAAAGVAHTAHSFYGEEIHTDEQR